MKKLPLGFSLILGMLVFLVFQAAPAQAATTNVANYDQLLSAVNGAVDNDVINITQDITVSAAIAVTNKAITIVGNGFTVSVPRPGLDASGIYNSNPSTFRVFNINASGKTVEIRNLTVKGGATASSAAGILNNSGTTLKLTGVSISNSLCSGTGGGALVNLGTAYVKDSNISRNAAQYGGGFLNKNGALMFIENSTFSENRSTSSAGGGGAGENNGTLYLNNSTFANNKSTELGGAINNYSGTLYAVNSTFTGNVAYGSYAGGAIANNGGSVTVINSLFAYNYRNTGTTNAPVYALSDIYKYSGSLATAYYSIFQNLDAASITADASNITYSANADGSDNTIFTGGSNTKILGPDGAELGTNTVFQPFLIKENASSSPTAILKVGSFAIAKGTQTGFSNGNGTPTVGYYNGSSWATLVGGSASSSLVVTDQDYDDRGAAPAVGAKVNTASGVYMLKVNSASNGLVNGATVYGDVYASGANVTLTAIANNGYSFANWNYVLGGSGVASTSNPYTFSLNQNTTLAPTFNVLASGYTITYVGNGSTGGSVPAAQSSAGSGDDQTIAGPGTLTKTGFGFSGWDTNANGSGATYNPGDVYSSTNTNLTLYAQYASAPVAPSSVTAGITSATSANIAWTDNSNDETSFSLDQSTDGITYVNVASAAANATSFAVTGLTPNTPYWFRVSAIKNGMVSSYATTSSSTNTWASAPSSVSAIADSGTAITVSWGGGAASSYDASGADGDSGWIGGNSYQFTGLSCNTSYTFRVKARNADGLETAATTVDQTTAGCSGGSSPLIPPSGIGTGLIDRSVSSAQTADIGLLDVGGINYLGYINSQINFLARSSKYLDEKSHNLKITDLDLGNKVIIISLDSMAKNISLKKGDSVEVDLDNDGINDISIMFTNIWISRAELTIKSISNISIDSPKIVAPAVSVKQNLRFVFKKDLKLGMASNDVKELQKYLNAHGFAVAKVGPGSPGKEIGRFGAATKAAVIKFQKAKGIKPAQGYFGLSARTVANQ